MAVLHLNAKRENMEVVSCLYNIQNFSDYNFIFATIFIYDKPYYLGCLRICFISRYLSNPKQRRILRLVKIL